MKIDNLKKKIILLEKEENNLKNKKVKIIQKSKYNQCKEESDNKSEPDTERRRRK